MFSFHLKSGYHQVDIFQGHQTYLGFSWKHSNSSHVKFYVFTVLSFGFSSALTCRKKFSSLLRKIGGIRVFALLSFLMIEGVMNRILKCAVL